MVLLNANFQSSEFPVSVEVLVDILEILAPVKHLSKLRQLCQSRLPPGFPVKLGGHTE